MSHIGLHTQWDAVAAAAAAAAADDDDDPLLQCPAAA